MKFQSIRLAACSLMLALLPLLQGCPALLLVAIAYSDNDYATVTVEIPRSADEVFERAVKLSSSGVEQGTGERYTVKGISKTTHFMRIEADNGSWWLELNLVPLGDNSCQLIMTGRSPGDMATQKHRGLLAVERLCDDLGVRYRVVENTPKS